MSDADQNLRVNVDTGALADGGPNTAGARPDRGPNYGSGGQDPGVTAVAYTKSSPPSPRTPDPNAPSTGTALNDIDANRDILAVRNSPNAGTLDPAGPPGVDAKLITVFDIVTTGDANAGTANRAFAALQPKGRGSSAFYGVDPGIGQVSRIDRTNGKRTNVEGLAIPIAQP